MQGGFFAAIAAAAATADIGTGAHQGLARHAHRALHNRGVNLNTAAPVPTGAGNATWGCTTIYTTITGEGSLYFPPAPATSSVAPVPTPNPTTCPTPGVYTIPATTITLTESTTVCAATSTAVGPGPHTAGGVTTTVTEATTVTCPYAAVETTEGTVTSVIKTTTYVCPSAGVYTIGAQTTACNSSTAWVYPVPTSYAPGTYTAPEITTTITETDYVVYCPFTSSAASLATSAPAPVVTTTTQAPVSTAPATSAAAQAVTSSAAPVSTSTSSSSGSLGTSGEQWSIVYTPYTTTGECKSEAQVYIDVALIASKGFSALRVYSTDCSTLEYVGGACKVSGVKMILGVFISSTGLSAAQEQVTAIASWAQWELVELISIGNEAIFNGYVSASELVGFISSSASSFQAAGYTGQCTTTETLNIWQANSAELCAVVDVVSCNIHPFFNADVYAASAGDFVSGQLDIVDGICSGKSGIVLETGWPSEGSCNGAACPSSANQGIALQSIKDTVGGKSCILSFENDLWKSPGEFGCETSWGAISWY